MKQLKTIFTTTFIIVHITTHYAQTIWKQLNGPIGGYTSCIYSNPTTQNQFICKNYTLLKGNGVGGYFLKSKDKGMSYQYIGQNLENQAVFKMVESSKGDKIWIATIDTMAGLQATAPLRMYHSIDSGMNFTLMNISIFKGADLMSPLLLSAKEDTLFTTSVLKGVMYSVDNGINWSTLNNGLPTFKVRNIIKVNGRGLFCTTDSISGNVGNIYQWISNKWQPLNGLGGGNVMTLSTNNKILVATTTSNGLSKVFISYDYLSFTEIKGYGTANGDVALLSTINSKGKIFINKKDNGIWEYDTASKVWANIGSSLPAQINQHIVVRWDDVLIAVNRYGIYSYIGNQWVESNAGYIGHDVVSLAITDSNNILAGTQTGIFKSNDTGNTWRLAGMGEQNAFFISQPYNGVYYAGNVNGKLSHLYQSVDGGNSWKKSDSGMNINGVTSMVQSSNGNYFAGSGWARQLYTSQNGKFWTANITFPQGSTVTITVAINKLDHIFMGMETYGVYRTDDLGKTFKYLGIPGGDVTSIVVNDNQDVFVASAISNTQKISGLYRSRDNGNSWLAPVLDKMGYINNILTLSKDTVLVASTTGIYFSSDTGNTWVKLFAGMNHKVSQSLAIDKLGYLYAGMGGGSVYRTTQPFRKTTTSINISSIDPKNLAIKNILSKNEVVNLSQIDGLIEYSLLNIDGKLIKQDLISKDFSISETGCYILIVRDSQNQYHKRVLIVK